MYDVWDTHRTCVFICMFTPILVQAKLVSSFSFRHIVNSGIIELLFTDPINIAKIKIIFSCKWDVTNYALTVYLARLVPSLVDRSNSRNKTTADKKYKNLRDRATHVYKTFYS